MRSRSCARIARPLRTSASRLSHEQETLEHGGAREWHSRCPAAKNDRSLLRIGNEEIHQTNFNAPALVRIYSPATDFLSSRATNRAPATGDSAGPMLDHRHPTSDCHASLPRGPG